MAGHYSPTPGALRSHLRRGRPRRPGAPPPSRMFGPTLGHAPVRARPGAATSLPARNGVTMTVTTTGAPPADGPLDTSAPEPGPNPADELVARAAALAQGAREVLEVAVGLGVLG